MWGTSWSRGQRSSPEARPSRPRMPRCWRPRRPGMPAPWAPHRTAAKRMVVTGSGARDAGEAGATRGGRIVSDRRLVMPPWTRRTFLQRSAVTAAGLAAAGSLPSWRAAMAQDAATINALVPAAPDPTPPGVPDATYSQATQDAFAQWQASERREGRRTRRRPGPSSTTRWPPTSRPASTPTTSCTCPAGCRSSLTSWCPSWTSCPRI